MYKLVLFMRQIKLKLASIRSQVAWILCSSLVQKLNELQNDVQELFAYIRASPTLAQICVKIWLKASFGMKHSDGETQI